MTDTATEFVEASTRAGRVRGRRRADGSIAFLGIPFAEPPVGELRFAAPVPHRSWEGVRPALEFGATPQRTTLSEITLIPEPSVPGDSTLNVNVFTPAADPDAGLPVLVYIHGGGFTAGSPASPWYDGAAFNRDGVVTVSISYRLGFDGFGWISDAPHNRALLDWLLALSWVRDNIRGFGGDPARVTVGGQSAGGIAAVTLLAMPAAQSLFHAAYAISPPAAAVPADRAESLGRRLAELAGVEPTRAGLSTLSEERVLELQTTVTTPDAADPMAMMASFMDDGLAWAPMIDGELLPQPPLDAIRAGVGADKPLVIGATDDEFSMVLDQAKGKLRFVPAGLVLGRIGVAKSTRAAYLRANSAVRRRGTAAMIGRYLTDRMFGTAVLSTVAARGDAPTWLYRFSWVSPTYHYAMHCLDVPFFFDCLADEHVAAIAGDAPPQRLADEVHAGAVAFVRTGDPGWAEAGADATARVYDVPSSVQHDAYASVRPLLATAQS